MFTELSYGAKNLSKPDSIWKRYTRHSHLNLHLKGMFSWQQDIWNYKRRRFEILKSHLFRLKRKVPTIILSPLSRITSLFFALSKTLGGVVSLSLSFTNRVEKRQGHPPSKPPMYLKYQSHFFFYSFDKTWSFLSIPLKK